MFCKKCNKQLEGDEKFCIHCGAPAKTQSINLQNKESLVKKYRQLILPVIIIGGALLVSALIAFGTLDKVFINNTFEKAFFYRAVGNCDDFVQYMAVDKDQWLERCTKEKNRDGTVPIKEFEILRIDRQDGKAFLQVQLTREGDPYSAHYEMVKEGWKWKIVNEI